MIRNLCPKVILEGARLTHKTDVAFALNEHPRFVGKRKYRYHSPIISAEWGGLENEAWGQSLINFELSNEQRAIETFELWIKLIEHLPYTSWIIDRFHLSTVMYQQLYHRRTYDLESIEERLVQLGFRLVLCYREPRSFAKARKKRLEVPGNRSQYDDVERFAREQENLVKLFDDSKLPKLMVNASDDDVSRMTEEIVEWFMPRQVVAGQEKGGEELHERPALEFLALTVICLLIILSGVSVMLHI
jgi:hypothetical protein